MFNKLYKTVIVAMSVALLTACAGGNASNDTSSAAQSVTEAEKSESKAGAEASKRGGGLGSIKRRRAGSGNGTDRLGR